MAKLTEKQMLLLEDYLEGRLSGEDLAQLESWVQGNTEGRGYLAFLKDLKTGSPASILKPAPDDLVDKVIDRLAKPASSPVPSFSWMKTGIAFACVVLVLLGGRWFFTGHGEKNPAAIETSFSLNAPRAKKVEVAGDFSAWKRVPLAPKNGRWGLRLTITPGRDYEYVFILNDKVLLTDPNNARIIRDRHGDLYSVLRTTTERSEVTKMKIIVSNGTSKALSVFGLCLALFSPPAAYAEDPTPSFLVDIQKQAQAAGLTPRQSISLLDQAKKLAEKGVPEKTIQEVADQALTVGKGPVALKALDRLGLLVSEGLAPEDAGKVAIQEVQAGAKPEEKTSPDDQEMEKSLEKGLTQHPQGAQALTPAQLEEKLEEKRQEWEERMEREKEIRNIQHEASERAP